MGKKSPTKPKINIKIKMKNKESKIRDKIDDILALTHQRSPQIQGLWFENESYTDIPTVVECLEDARLERTPESYAELVDLVARSMPSKREGKDLHYEHYALTSMPSRATAACQAEWKTLLNARRNMEQQEEIVQETEELLSEWGERGQRLLHMYAYVTRCWTNGLKKAFEHGYSYEECVIRLNRAVLSRQRKSEAVGKRRHPRVMPGDAWTASKGGKSPAPVTTQDLDDFGLIINDLGLVESRRQYERAQPAAAQGGVDQSADQVSRPADVDDDDDNGHDYRSRKRRRL
ncbi:hypothetical protein ASPACDRAFT_64507 [Aspergillus aculeatus ATCC 16872]|uniref:Uncharacterized protein n=1 Tax=Aspergillus aculeatus (strain ATCC 16872 / CBS 172.66 / WB 5094) TaxID=690307 RepID=A0A1L9WGJ4_ASPA1|nr:uncharacterized protein ASPACDRAFT_64507 [Aspergillus aculeatus ATCC 16872]OJJ95227.1 hypothetical protein ASPACDRAFT_64507 [Aspergillus aculeatus ATCC 16872]